MDVPVIPQLSVVVSHYKLLSYVCVFMAGKTQTNPAPVLWSIKLWLILPVMWKQRVYKMLSHNGGMIWLLWPRKWMLQAVRFFTWRWSYGLWFLLFRFWCCISYVFNFKITMRIVNQRVDSQVICCFLQRRSSALLRSSAVESAVHCKIGC